MQKGLITLCWHRQMPLYIFSLRSRRLSHEIENDPFVEIYSGHELLSHCDEEKIFSFIFMKLLKKHSIAEMKNVPTFVYIGRENQYLPEASPAYRSCVFFSETKFLYLLLLIWYLCRFTTFKLYNITGGFANAIIIKNREKCSMLTVLNFDFHLRS